MRNRIFTIGQCLVLAMVGLCIAASAQAQTYTFSTLYSFENNGNGTLFPNGVIIDSPGNLYGTSENGGRFGLGEVFELTKGGAFSVLHSFKGGATDGENPFAGVVRDAKGNLYGATSGGGSHGYGTVFKLTSPNRETILYNFISIADGYSPGGVLLNSAGNLYGTASGGATSYGFVFEISTADKYSVLYNFCSLPNCADGDDPALSLIDTAGNLYGTTSNIIGHGVIFELTPKGVETVLHTFDGTDGDLPESVLLDSEGNLYGATYDGGAHEWGTLFSLPQAGGTLTTLYNFCSLSRCDDGKSPLGAVRDTSGNYYGTALQAADNTGAVVWEVNSEGKETVLYTFAEGVQASPLIIDSAGNLYGTTSNGGANSEGSVFKLTLVK
jgi:uncharacterized repeat protein (TIGR03803 family)